MWNPWGEADRQPDVIVTFKVLPDWTGGACVTYIDGWAVVTIDPRLGPQDRDAALTHELVHAERDRGRGATLNRSMPSSWHAVEAREEHIVNREVARRMVDLDDLEEFVDGMCSLGLGVGPDEVAEQFEVTPQVARDALLLLAHPRPVGRLRLA